MILIEKTCIVDRYNLINTEKEDGDDDKYIRQLSKQEVIDLGISIINIIK